MERIRKFTKEELGKTQFGTGYSVTDETGINIIIPMKDGSYLHYHMSDNELDKECREYPEEYHYKGHLVDASKIVLLDTEYDGKIYTKVISIIGKMNNHVLK